MYKNAEYKNIVPKQTPELSGPHLDDFFTFCICLLRIFTILFCYIFLYSFDLYIVWPLLVDHQSIL